MVYGAHRKINSSERASFYRRWRGREGICRVDGRPCARHLRPWGDGAGAEAVRSQDQSPRGARHSLALPDEDMSFPYNVVSPGYFDTMGFPSWQGGTYCEREEGNLRCYEGKQPERV
jgi:hypothetical protein